MDVISLSKAMKAKKAMKALDDRIGVGVQDVHGNAKTRIEELEKKDPGTVLNKRVSALETSTHINLNKHNLRLVTIGNQQKYKMENLAFDDFGDSTGIDATKSVRHLFDSVGRRFKIVDGQTTAEIVTTAESLDATPTRIVVSQASNKTQQKLVSFDLANGVTTNTEVVGGEVKLKSTDGGATYPYSGFYETPVLDLGDNVKDIANIKQAIVYKAAQYTEDITPTMASENAPSPFALSASSYVNPNLPWKAFDKNGLATENSWLFHTNQLPVWIQMDFGTNRKIGKYSIVPSDYYATAHPKNWTFEGSNDGVNFVVLDTRVNVIDWVMKEEKNFALSQIADFRYYRIKVTANMGFVYGAIGEIKMMEPLLGATTDLQFSTSSDGETFSGFKPFTMEGLSEFGHERYLKLKAELKPAILDTATALPFAQVDAKMEKISNDYVFKELLETNKWITNIQNWSTASVNGPVKILSNNKELVLSSLMPPEPVKDEVRIIKASSWGSFDASLKINTRNEIIFNSNVIL